MGKPESLDRLAQREVEYEAIAQRARHAAIRRIALVPILSISTAALVAPRDGFPWASYVLGTAMGVAAAAVLLPILRRFAPASFALPSFSGLRRTERWEIYRAMWHKRALDLGLLPIVEEMARATRRAFPFLAVILGLCGVYIASALGDGNDALPRWYTIPVLLGIPFFFGQQIYFIRRSELVARLTREGLPQDVDWEGI